MSDINLLKKDDFIEVDYTGKLADSGEVFDTTNAEIAKKADIPSDRKYESVVVQLGKNHLLKGIERQLEGKEIGNEYKFKVSPEEGFGKKTAKLIQLVSTAKFREQKIVPMVGMQVNIDGVVGVIRAVSGGRVIVDFNHPLAGRELEYEVVVKRKVTDVKERLGQCLRFLA